MVGLHVMNDEVVDVSSLQRLFEVGFPRVNEVLIGSVKHRHLVVDDDIRVHRHTFGYGILVLEKRRVDIVNTDVIDIVRNTSHVFGFVSIEIKAER